MPNSILETIPQMVAGCISQVEFEFGIPVTDISWGTGNTVCFMTDRDGIVWRISAEIIDSVSSQTDDFPTPKEGPFS